MDRSSVSIPLSLSHQDGVDQIAFQAQHSDVEIQAVVAQYYLVEKLVFGWKVTECVWRQKSLSGRNVLPVPGPVLVRDHNVQDDTPIQDLPGRSDLEFGDVLSHGAGFIFIELK